MKYKDYARLGKISIKSRKKSTRNTVRGISFGLILLVPVIFFTLAFYLDLTGAMNRVRNVSSFSVTTVNEMSQRDGYDGKTDGIQSRILGKTESRALSARVGAEVEEIVRQEYFYMGNEISVRLDGMDLMYQQQRPGAMWSPEVNESIKIVGDKDGAESVIPQAFYEDLEKKEKTFLVEGEGFSENSRGEILVSEWFATKWGSSASAMIGKELSVSARLRSGNNNCYLDNDNNPDNEFSQDSGGMEREAILLDRFRVVGIISNDYYELNSKTQMDSHLWMTGASYFDAEEESWQGKYLPIVRSSLSEEGEGYIRSMRVVTYPDGLDTMQQNAAREKMFFPALPAVVFYSPYQYGITDNPLEQNVCVLTVQCASYQSAQQVSRILNAGYERLGAESGTGGDMSLYATSSYQNFYLLHQVGTYLMVILYTFGGIIFFATLLNLYNSVNYSVQARRNYLGMMQAIGAKKSIIPKLYFVEILLIFRKSLLWVLIFGGALSYGIKALIDMAFSYGSEMFGVAIQLNFTYFFAALGVALVAVFLVAFVFSRVACLTITRKSVLDVLTDDK